jgi:Predicted transcriptional regulator
MTIKELRISKNLTQAKMAEMIGVKPAVISRLENGRMSVSEEIAEKIREVFGAEVGDPEKHVVKKISSRKMEIYIQSPLGGNITPEEIEARMPEGTRPALCGWTRT